MTDLNLVMLLGRLVRKPEVRTSANGAVLGSFCVAVNRHYRDKNGQTKEEVAFVPCTAFGKSAEKLTEKQKGEPVLAVGRLKTDSWRGEGANQSRLVLIAEDVRFVSTLACLMEPNQTQDSIPGLEEVKKSIPF